MRSLSPSPLNLRFPALARLVSLCALQLVLAAVAPRAAIAGPYTDAGHSPAEIAAWASRVEELVRGPLDLAAPGAGFASFGHASQALGPATTDPGHVVSLGDGGWLVAQFSLPVHNGPGDDLVVFENGFLAPEGQFAELAFVEVSSDGIDFARFPATALNGFPVAAFDALDPTDYHGLAGRHELGLGTGFDLAALAGHPLVASGALDLQDVRQVRIVDVVGDGSRVDAGSNPIFDPYPTPFASGGFDLEAVGALAVPEPRLAAGLCLGALALMLPRRRFVGSRTPSPVRPRRALPLGGLLALLVAGPAAALHATFDDLGLGPNAYENGANLAGGFTSGGIFFENDYLAAFDVFSGFAASTMTDATTPGFGNQFSAIPGGGAGGSAGYGVHYSTGSIVFPEPTTVLSAALTNTTYAALSMRDGDPFSKRFGGASGSDPDFFRLTIEGIAEDGLSTGQVELLLADFRFEDDALDFILDQWVVLDLTGLGTVHSLRFAYASSDVGPFGINTPTYFAIDDLQTIPEPGVGLLLGLGLALLAAPRSHAGRR